jgi:catalase (peroxidase I)
MGVLDRPGLLGNDFFSSTSPGMVMNGFSSSKLLWPGSAVVQMDLQNIQQPDLMTGSNAQLRNIAEVYGARTTQSVSLETLSWDKVMADRYDER